MTPFDYETGVLDAGRSIWKTAGSSSRRQQTTDSNSDIPTLSSPNRRTEGSKYMYFTHSGWKADVAQHTVPFFDAMPVMADPPAWITGLDLYHKGRENYAGFISFAIAPYNIDDGILKI